MGHQPPGRYFEWRVMRRRGSWRPFYQRIGVLDGGSIDYLVGPVAIRKQVHFRDRYFVWRIGLTPARNPQFVQRSVLRDGGSVEWSFGRLCIGRYVRWLR